MVRSRFMVVLVLLFAPFLAVSQTVGGQGYVTQTVTTFVTNSQSSIVTVEPSVVTSTAPQSQPIFSAPFTLPPTHGVCGTYFVQPFNATTGEDLSGNLTADSKVDFYVMTDADFQKWSHQIVAGGNCAPPSPVLSQRGTTSFNFTTKITDDGLYQIVVNNLSTSTVTANLTADIITSAPVMVTMVMYSTLTQSNVQTLTLITLSSASTESGLSGNSTLIIGALLVVVIIVVALVARSRRGKAESK